MVNDGPSLEELENDRWGDPDPGATSVIRDAHRLRRVPVSSLSVGDLRFLLGQGIGTNWLVPLALDQLQLDPLAGSSYPGDLLNAVLRIEPEYWASNAAQLASLWLVRRDLEERRDTLNGLVDRDDWPGDIPDETEAG